jgi:hypothetical protein
MLAGWRIAWRLSWLVWWLVSWLFYFYIFVVLLQELFSQNVADIIAELEKMVVDKGANLVAVPRCFVGTGNVALRFFVKDVEEFLFHGFSLAFSCFVARIIFTDFLNG